MFCKWDISILQKLKRGKKQTVVFQIPFASTMWDLVLPHFFLGLGIGIVDSALMPLLAVLVDLESNGSAYGSVYAIAQTAVSLAYGFGPLCGGKLSETYGFPEVMRFVGFLNVLYIPAVYILKHESQTSKHETVCIVVK